MRGDLRARPLDRLRRADPGALRGRRRPAVTATQSDGSDQLARQGVDLDGEVFGTLGVAPISRLVELCLQIGESAAVRGLRLGVEELAGVTEPEPARGDPCIDGPGARGILPAGRPR